MSLNRMLQVLLPQPGEDLRSWASSLVAQLQFLLQQQANDTQMLSSAPATAPLYQSDGNTLVITDVGEYKLADGTVIVDANGLHVKDLVGFDVINGPTIRIDTAHLVDNAITTSKLAAGAVTADKFFGNLEPIEVVAALPNPVGYVGPPVVLLSSDGKLYRYTAGAWTAAVPTVDLTGQITTTQITDGAITTPKLVAGAVTTEKITAGAVTANELAANSVIAAKIDAGAVTAAKLAAASVVAGKLAANAIVANDGVIANAAIVDAQIATLNASKINAGDIAAARMSTNIVTALTGKFATLSALAASLGVVQIQTGGALLTQGVTTYTSGTGLWTGENGGVYKFRIGNPAGARLDWDGSSLNIYTAANQLVLKSGAFTLRTNQIAPFNFWTMFGSNFVNLGGTWSYDGTTLVIPSGSSFVASNSPTMNLSGQGSTFIVSFKARGIGRTLTVDLFPDTLPESSFLLTGDWEEYSATWTSTHADLSNCVLRFFADSVAAQVEIADVMLTIGTERTLFVPHVRAGIGVRNQLTASNVSTYMANATIGTAQIIDANITTAKIADANITSAKIADANITSAKIGSLQVTTLKIADAAVTAPYFVLGTNTTMVTAFPTEYTFATFNITTSEVADIVVIVTARFINNSGANLSGSMVITTSGYTTTHRWNRVDANWEDTMTVSEIFIDAAAGSRTIDVKGRINVNNASGITVSDITCSAVVYKK